MFGLSSWRSEYRLVDDGKVSCPLRMREVEADLCAGCGWASRIDTRAEAPFVACRVDLPDRLRLGR